MPWRKNADTIEDLCAKYSVRRWEYKGSQFAGCWGRQATSRYVQGTLWTERWPALPEGELWAEPKGGIGSRWPVKRGQRGQPGQMHVTLRSDVGLFIYTSSPEQSAELQTKKSNCPLTPSFGHHNEHLRYSTARPDLLVSFRWLPYPPALTIFLLV